MELQQYARVLKPYWRSIVAITLVCLAAAAALTLVLPPKYTATTSVFLSVESGSSAADLSQGASYAENQVTSFATLTTSQVVLAPVVGRLKLHMTVSGLAKQIAVTSPTSTSIINITATAGDAGQAAGIADAVGESLVTTVARLAPPASSGSGLVKATIVNKATVPTSPTSPKPLTNLALGLVLGVVVGGAQALIRSALDTRIKNADDLTDTLDAPLLAAVGHVGAAAESGGYVTGDPTTEAYRRLRTNVGFLMPGVEGRRSLVVTSPSQAEGKTQTIIGLARMLAQAGDRVLLIDADMRRPTLAQRLGLDSEPGLSQVLAGRGRFQDFVLQVDESPLFVLPAGSLPPNPAELLASRAMESLLEVAEESYDYVLLDSPPVIPVTDAVVIAERVSGVILVVRAGRTRFHDAKEAARLLQTASVTIAGTVVNDVPRRGGGGYGRYDSAYYSSSESRRPAQRRGNARGRRAQRPAAVSATRAAETDSEFVRSN